MENEASCEIFLLCKTLCIDAKVKISYIVPIKKGRFRRRTSFKRNNLLFMEPLREDKKDAILRNRYCILLKIC